jgi:hypothetical protein
MKSAPRRVNRAGKVRDAAATRVGAVLDVMRKPAYSRSMSPIAQQLAEKLDQWEPEVSRRVETLVAEIMDLAEAGALEFLRSRAVEQEVLDLLDEPVSR